MARIHRRLSTEQGEALIKSRRFILDLCDDLRELHGCRTRCFYRVSGSQPPTCFAAGGAVRPDCQRACNEFAQICVPGRSPRICSCPFERRGDELVLSVTDDGVGSTVTHRGSGMGQQLVTVLGQQLGGQVDIRSSDRGTRVTVAFPTADKTHEKPCMAKQSCVRIEYKLASDRIPDRQHRDDDGTPPLEASWPVRPSARLRPALQLHSRSSPRVPSKRQLHPRQTNVRLSRPEEHSPPEDHRSVSIEAGRAGRSGREGDTRLEATDNVGQHSVSAGKIPGRLYMDFVDEKSAMRKIYWRLLPFAVLSISSPTSIASM